MRVCPLHNIELVPVGVYQVQCPLCGHIEYTSITFKDFHQTSLPFWCN